MMNFLPPSLVVSYIKPPLQGKGREGLAGEHLVVLSLDDLITEEVLQFKF